MRAPLLRILPLGFSAVFGALLATGCGDGDDTKPSQAAGGAGGMAGSNEAGEPTGPGPGTSGGDAGAPATRAAALEGRRCVVR